MARDDLDSHARSNQDYYALLEVAEGATESEIRKAYRRTALKYHPDKNAGDVAAVEKFHLLSIANDVLSDPSAKAVYDHGRQARREKELRESAYSDNRKRMIEKLERAERGIKRPREEDEEHERMEAELNRLRADGARRRRERAEKLRKQFEEEARLDESETPDIEMEDASNGHGEILEVPEMDRAVKIQWERHGKGSEVSKEDLKGLFERFGEVDMVIGLKDKKSKTGESKRVLGVATLVFKSIASALAAVEDTHKVTSDFPSLNSVAWSKKEEPQIIKEIRDRMMGLSAPTTPKDGRRGDSPKPQLDKDDMRRLRLRFAQQRRNAKPMDRSAEDGTNGGIRKVPSFASFKGVGTPQKLPGTPQASARPTFASVGGATPGTSVPKFPSYNSPFTPRSTPLATTSAFASPALESARKDKAREQERERLIAEMRRAEDAEEAEEAGES